MHPVKTFKIIYQFVRRIRTFLNLFYYLRMRGNILLWIYVCMNEVNCALPFNYIENAINIRLRRLSFSTFQHWFKLKLMSLSLVPCHPLIRKKTYTYLNSTTIILIMKILCLVFFVILHIFANNLSNFEFYSFFCRFFNNGPKYIHFVYCVTSSIQLKLEKAKKLEEKNMMKILWSLYIS